MNYTGRLINKYLPRGIVLLCMVSLLASCATMQGEPDSSTSSAANTRQNDDQGNQEETNVPSSTSASATAGGSDSNGDPGINRTGRIIQLGRFSEERPQVEVPEGTTVELNYEQEDLRLVFEQLGDQLQINMVIDPTIDDRVSLRSSPDNPLEYDDLWPLMRMLASNAGVTIEQAGNVYRFMKNNSSIPPKL